MGLADRDYGRYDEDGGGRAGVGYGGGGGSSGGHWRWWTMTVWIIMASVVGTLYQMVAGGAQTLTAVDQTLTFIYLSDKATQGQVWRLITYPYFGFDILNTLFSLIMFYFSANLLEPIWGRARLLIVYTLMTAACALGATLFATLFFKSQAVLTGAWVPVLALFVTGAMRFPRAQVGLFFIPIYFDYRIFGYVVAACVAIAMLLGSQYAVPAAGVAMGIAFGALITRFPQLLGFADSLDGSFFKRLIKRWQARQQEIQARNEAKLQSEVDRILQKVRESGLQSLTEAEKRTLKRATELENQKPKRF
jgi:membrane associated rhomboid family serine protease